MDNVSSFKIFILTIVGAIGSGIANLLGGWDMALQTLIIFMGIDYLTGLIVAGVFKKSNKTQTGALESKAGWKGLCKKGMTLLIVLVATRLDMAIGSNIIRDAVVIGYMVNEAISITENAGLMGLPIPPVITKAIDVLKRQSEKEGE
jgi:toxin secretion/phage lysis holin